ncbi:hypothetical protein ACFWFU_03315 [Streptomyces sp. NPDC060235]|uniref:hypothetical protein n=1 Tax=Streptomyces sp. NPDC060235 TaxID=3347080 RepID=UPI003664CEFD
MIEICPDSSGEAEGGKGSAKDAGGVAAGGGDVGATVLTVDADGKVAQADHDAWEATDVDRGVALAESTVADVVQEIFNLPVPYDPGRKLGAGRRAGRQAGDQVDALDGEAGEVLSPARDL